MPNPNRYLRADDKATKFKNKRILYRTETQMTCPLFRLPLELRQEIYRLILPGSYIILPAGSSVESQQKRTSSKYALGKAAHWNEKYQSPTCLWSPGDFVLLRLCRRICEEATPLFYEENTFELFLSDSVELRVELRNGLRPPKEQFIEPVLKRTYCTLINQHLYREEMFDRSPSPVYYKRLSWVKREHLRQIRHWSIMVLTHYSREFAYPNEDDPIYHDEDNDVDWSYEREQYRDLVTRRLRSFCGMLTDNEDQIRDITISFEPYLDSHGKPWMVDNKLVRCVRRTLPDGMLESVVEVRGMIDKEELENWDIG